MLSGPAHKVVYTAYLSRSRASNTQVSYLGQADSLMDGLIMCACFSVKKTKQNNKTTKKTNRAFLIVFSAREKENKGNDIQQKSPAGLKPGLL